jgi:HD-GYP domain-containing protein (c-di-GMP phosphodiesterase class II)
MENKTPLLTPIFELVMCLAQAVDLVSPLVADHHKRTAQVAYGLGLQMKLPEDELRDLVIAASLHDVGGLTRADRLEALDFEYQNPLGHSVMGYLLLSPFGPFKKAADMVRFHHVAWDFGVGAQFDGLPVPRGSHLLQLADRLAILIDPAGDVLEQVDGILQKICSQAGERFVPEQVQALVELAGKEAFWLDTVYMVDLNYLGRRLKWQEIEIKDEEFLGLTNLFRRIIDFRSQFTSTHSAGVAATAESLARLCEFSESDCWIIHLAGLLHDLGKLAVPAEILEKPGRLTREEYDIVRRHTYFTFHILEPLKILDVVRVWGAFHHESMDGHGYPFHLEENEIPLGSRIVSVADIFTALTEDRPYRKGSRGVDALAMLQDASMHHKIDSEVVAILAKNLDRVDGVRCKAQAEAVDEYRHIIELSRQLTHIAS